MPRKMDFDTEIEATRRQIAINPTEEFVLPCRVDAITWLALLEDCVKHYREPVAHRLRKIVTAHYTHESGNFVKEQKSMLDALCRVWDCDVNEAIRRLLERAGPSVLMQEQDIRHKREQALASASRR